MITLNVGGANVNLEAMAELTKTQFMKSFKGRGVFKGDLEEIWKAIQTEIKAQRIKKKKGGK